MCPLGVRLLKGMRIDIDGIGKVGEAGGLGEGRIQRRALEIVIVIYAVSLGAVLKGSKG